MEKLYVTIYNDIVNKISDGTYLAGQKLPTEFEITELYNVSRITATRAMKELEKNLYVIRKQKSGTFVREFPTITPADSGSTLIPVILPFDKNLGINIIFGAQACAASNNVFTSFFHTQNNAKVEHGILEKVLEMKIGGVILCPCSTHENLDVLSKLALKNIPLVYIDRPVAGISAPCITSDNESGMFSLVEKLIAGGHTKIAYYPYHSNMIETEKRRFSGYCKAFIANNLVINTSYLFVNSANFKLSISPNLKQAEVADHYINIAIEYFDSLKEKPTAIVCANDVTAYAFIKCLRSRGYNVPDDVSVTGYDNIIFPDKSIGITTIEQDMYTMGTVAMESIINLQNSLPVPPYINLPTRLIERSSTKILKPIKRQPHV